MTGVVDRPSVASALTGSVQPAELQLDSAADFVIDDVAGLVYVSRRTFDDIKVVSLTTAQVVDTISVPGEPVGVELSADGTLLYVALFDAGEVIVVDLATETVDHTFDIATELDDLRTWELQRVEDKLYVSGNPSSNGFAYIVEIDLVAETAQRVADDEIIRAGPEFAWDGGDHLYVGSGFSPNSLYKLDLTDPDVPIVLEDDHGSVSGTQRLAANSNAVLIGSGQALDPSDFSVITTVAPGFPARRDDGGELYMALTAFGADALIARHDGTTLAGGVAMVTGCGLDTTPYHFDAIAGDAGFVLLGEDTLCIIAPFPTTIGTCAGLAPTIIGTNGPDTIDGTSGPDVIMALGGNDQVDGKAGSDVICGGDGKDILVGGDGNDELYGGAGNDTASFEGAGGPINASLADGTAAGPGFDVLSGIENLTGSAFDDTLMGNGKPNVIRGGAGSDWIDGRKGNDRLEGGDGNDLLLGGPGADLLLGGGGSDELYGEGGRDKLKGGIDRDLLVGGGGGDTLIGGGGHDDLFGGGGPDTLKGGSGDDLLVGGAKSDHLLGGKGIDLLEGGPGDDLLEGQGAIDVALYDRAPQGVNVSLSAGTAVGEGADTLIGIESVVGSDYNDVLTGTGKFNGFLGLAGNDTLRGGAGPDNLFGSKGNDLLYGEDGNDWLDGGAGTDTLNGSTGYDVCVDGEILSGCDETRTSSKSRESATTRVSDRLDWLLDDPTLWAVLTDPGA